MIVISSALALSESEPSSDNGVILYDNLITAENVTAPTSFSIEHPAINMANPATHLYWQGDGVVFTEFPVATFASFETVNSFGIAGHNLGTIGATITFFGRTNDLGDSPGVFVELMSGHILADDAPFMAVFEPQSVTQVFIQIDLVAATPAAKIAVWYAGEALVLERSIKIDAGHTPITMGRVTKVINGRSESGNFLGRILINEFRQSQAEFAWFTPAWYRTNFDPFVVASKQVPFFYAWHPSEYPLEVGYGWMLDDPMPEVDPVTQRIAVSLRYQGIV